MPTVKIADLPRHCSDPEHSPPTHQSFEHGIWQHTCPACGGTQTFVVDGFELTDWAKLLGIGT
jgi:Zn finger protein HypA/HybF involved in hydrogenase expression